MVQGSCDMKAYICSLPTREDMDRYVYRLETSYKTELQELKVSVQNTQEKMDIIDTRLTDMEQKIVQAEAKLQEQDQGLKCAINTIDDIENKNRRNNIRIRGLPETISLEDLIRTLRGIFNILLQNPPTTEIIFDWAHRTAGLRKIDPTRPRNVICRIHYFYIKEKIMLAARQNKTIDFEGTKIILFQDLSRHKLVLRKPLKPLLEHLQKRDIQYRWSFPFQLQVQHNGLMATFRDIEDLPEFLKTFQLLK